MPRSIEESILRLRGEIADIVKADTESVSMSSKNGGEMAIAGKM